MNAMPPNADPDFSKQPSKSITRRDFLAMTGKALVAASGLLGLGGLVKYLSYQPDPSPPKEFDLGLASGYPIGKPTLVLKARAVVERTQSGFTAFSLVCPHLGCTLEMHPDSYVCPCHGSKFDAKGNLLNGPANKPMQPVRIEETPEGKLILHTG